jgi:serine/threonine protein phosphatase PrpC
MITCPECGLAAPDDAKFCDRCGQGLGKSAPRAEPSTRPHPLEPGTVLKGGLEIIALLGQTSNENRYRAGRNADGKPQTCVIRERLADEHQTAEPDPVAQESAPPPKTENPAGPTAKTADLKLNRAASGGNSSHATAVSVEPAAAVSAEAETSASGAQAPAGESVANGGSLAAVEAVPDTEVTEELVEIPQPDDLGDAFGRVMALSLTLNHPAFQRALEGFAENDRVYLVYPDEELKPVHRAGDKMSESDAIAAAIQLCQAIGFVHRRALRLNDICPQSVMRSRDGRIKLTGLEYVSNDNELQSEPIFNDGYTAPEIYRAKRVDKRADIFSVGALLYTWLTAERIASESWREEAGPVQFYPPHVVSAPLELAIRRALAFDPKDRWANIDDLKAELTKQLAVVRVQAAALTDVGRVREHNEDAALAIEYTRDSLVEPARNYLFVVADGMGGAEAGEVAAAIAVNTIRGYVESGLASGRSANAAELLTSALEEANQRIIEYQAAHPESRGMGSTAVSALLLPPDAAVAWVGDSRVYLMEGDSLRQVTRDHSLVQRLVEIGQITAEEARHHEHKNVITRSLGARQSGPAGAESVVLKLKRGDRMVLCSDGLTAHVDDGALGEILGRNRDPYAAARELVAAANAGGGSDNITVVVVYAN